MRDRWYDIIFVTGTTDRVYGEAVVRDGVLIITEHYGVTYGVKSVVSYPLQNVLRWSADD